MVVLSTSGDTLVFLPRDCSRAIPSLPFSHFDNVVLIYGLNSVSLKSGMGRGGTPQMYTVITAMSPSSQDKFWDPAHTAALAEAGIALF